MEETTNNNQVPEITTAEISDWETKFKESVSPMVQFDTQDGKPSMRLYNGQSGIEASWAGTIILKADNYIKWSFSLMNEPFVEAKFNINDENKRIVDALYDFYNMWKEEWSKSISIPPSAETNTEMSTDGAPATLKESSRTKENIISDHSERMRILAGLL